MATSREARQAYLAVRDELLEYDNVIGVGFGVKEKGGKLTQQFAIIALVEEKLPCSRVPEGQLLPKAFENVPIDVQKPRISEEEHLEFLKRNGIPPEQNECNKDHFFLSDCKIHRLNLERQRDLGENIEPGNAPCSPATAVFGEIFVIEDNGTLISRDKIDHVAAYELFRTRFGDHYDFVFFHYDTASGVPSQGNSSPTIHNTITGIHHPQGDSYDRRATWGSAKIQSYQKVTNLTEVRRMLHETGHRWCAYVNHREDGVPSENLHKDFVIAREAPNHWGGWFDSGNSCMDYHGIEWHDSSKVRGEFEKKYLTQGPPGIDEFGYHPLDLYLMGLMSGEEVGTFRYIRDPDDPDNDDSYTGTEVNLDITNIIAEEGKRNPAYPDTQRVFHQAFILITGNLSGIGSLNDTSTVLGNFELYRSGYLDAFRKATRSRAMIDGSLLHDNYASLYIRDNSADTGTPLSREAFRNSPDIWVRNVDDGGTDHQDTIRNQDNYVHARIWNSSGADYEDVTVRFYRANFAGTEFYYPEDWHPDQLIGEDTVAVPAGGNAVARATWKSDFIPDKVWCPCLLVEIIPMEVVPENRHPVWDNRKLAQKNINIVDPPEDNEGEMPDRA